MFSLRKWLYKPKRTDTSLLAQFYYADDELNQVAAELDSFDGRKEPERCTALVNQLRQCQDNVLGVVNKIHEEVVPATLRVQRDYRVKFPDDVLQESLAGQLWFGAECLAAGSSILNREVESASMRPLAKAVTRTLDMLRAALRDQCLRNSTTYNEKIKELLIEFDHLFADFELSYVSAMVPVKSMKEHDVLQEVTVLFCEAVNRALKLDLLTQDMIDDYDPALMFTIPRLAIVCGLVVYPEGPLNPDRQPSDLSEMFRHFQALLLRIRELLLTLTPNELFDLEKSLCSAEEPGVYRNKPPDSRNNVVVEHSIDATQFVHDRSVSVIEDPRTPTYEFEIKLPIDGAGIDGADYDVVDLEVSTGSTATLKDVIEQINAQDIDVDNDVEGIEEEELGPQHIVDDEQRPNSVDSGVPSEDEVIVPSPPRNEVADDDDENVFVEVNQAVSLACIGVSREVQTDPLNALQVDQIKTKRLLKQRTQSTQTDMDSHLLDWESSNEVFDGLVDDAIVEIAQRTVQMSLIPMSSRKFSFNLPCNTNPGGAESGALTPPPNTPRTFVYHTVDCKDFPSTPGNSKRNFKRPVTNKARARSSSSDEGSKKLRNQPQRKLSKKRHTSEHQAPLKSITEQQSSQLHRTSGNNAESVFSESCGSGLVGHDVQSVSCDVDGENETQTLTVRLESCDQCDSTGDKQSPIESAILDPNDVSHDNQQTNVMDGSSVCINVETSADCHSVSSSSTEGPDSSESEGEILERRQSRPYLPSETSSYTSSECNDDEEIALAVQAAELATRNETRQRFHSSSDLIHRLFVCISGVADQLQTNYASDLRNVLKSVFEVCSMNPLEQATSPVDSCEELGEEFGACSGSEAESDNSHLEGATADNNYDSSEEYGAMQSMLEPPEWVPDQLAAYCTSCHIPFTFVRRRHHCRNCGKIFCSRCSGNSLPLPHIGHTSSVRVCNGCFMFQVNPFVNE